MARDLSTCHATCTIPYFTLIPPKTDASGRGTIAMAHVVLRRALHRIVRHESGLINILKKIIIIKGKFLRLELTKVQRQTGQLTLVAMISIAMPPQVRMHMHTYRCHPLTIALPCITRLLPRKRPAVWPRNERKVYQ